MVVERSKIGCCDPQKMGISDFNLANAASQALFERLQSGVRVEPQINEDQLHILLILSLSSLL